MKKSFADQIATWEATSAQKTKKMDEILSTAAEGGVTLDSAQKEEHDTLETEVAEIKDTVRRLKSAQDREAAAAVPVSGATPQEGLRARQGSVITVERNLPKGHLFARYAMCIAGSRGIPGEAMRLAKEHYRDDPGVLALVEKSAVAGGATSGSHYIDDMVPYAVMNDFIEYLRPGSIIGKFGGPNPGGGGNYPSLNRVGFNERVSGMSTGYTAGWKGEGLPALPSAAVTFNTSLTWNCMSALAVLTKEAVRFSNPSAEERVRNDLAKAVNTKLDVDFIDPAKAASGTTSPASITNNIVAITPTGTTAAFLITNLSSLIAPFAQNNLDPSDIVLIMSAQMALQISMMTTTFGNAQFPDISMKGGVLRGFPVIVSENLTAVGSPSTQTIVAVKASEVYLADDGVVTVEASDQASIEMQDTSSQTAISGTGASLVSLWQTGAVGLMANREITWKLRRSTAVQYLSPAAYAA
jgi:HK97 family phage major capsid protein